MRSAATEVKIQSPTTSRGVNPVNANGSNELRMVYRELSSGTESTYKLCDVLEPPWFESVA